MSGALPRRDAFGHRLRIVGTETDYGSCQCGLALRCVDRQPGFLMLTCPNGDLVWRPIP